MERRLSKSRERKKVDRRPMTPIPMGGLGTGETLETKVSF